MAENKRETDIVPPSAVPLCSHQMRRREALRIIMRFLGLSRLSMTLHDRCLSRQIIGDLGR